MPQASLSMRKIEEILRLKFELKLSHRAIARSCGVSDSTIVIAGDISTRNREASASRLTR